MSLYNANKALPVEDRPIASPEPRDPLAGASLVAEQIGRLIEALRQDHATLTDALRSGKFFAVNTAALKLATGGQSIHALGRMVQRDLSAYSRREARIRS